jgi:hypothetical protein
VNSRTRPVPPYTALDDYGLLRTLVLVDTLGTGLPIRALLNAGGVRATVSTGTEGLVHVLVFSGRVRPGPANGELGALS